MSVVVILLNRIKRNCFVYRSLARKRPLYRALRTMAEDNLPIFVLIEIFFSTWCLEWR